MPPVFKAFASITVWILFVFGCLAILGGFFRVFAGAPLPLVSAYFGYGVLTLFLSVVAAKLRQSL